MLPYEIYYKILLHANFETLERCLQVSISLRNVALSILDSSTTPYTNASALLVTLRCLPSSGNVDKLSRDIVRTLWNAYKETTKEDASDSEGETESKGKDTQKITAAGNAAVISLLTIFHNLSLHIRPPLLPIYVRLTSSIGARWARISPLVRNVSISDILFHAPLQTLLQNLRMHPPRRFTIPLIRQLCMSPKMSEPDIDKLLRASCEHHSSGAVVYTVEILLAAGKRLDRAGKKEANVWYARLKKLADGGKLVDKDKKAVEV